MKTGALRFLALRGLRTLIIHTRASGTRVGEKLSKIFIFKHLFPFIHKQRLPYTAVESMSGINIIVSI